MVCFHLHLSTASHFLVRHPLGLRNPSWYGIINTHVVPVNFAPLTFCLTWYRSPPPPKGQGDLTSKKLEAGFLQNELQQMATHAAMASQMCTAMSLAKPRAGWANLGTLLHALSNTASAGGRPELYELLEVSSASLR